MNLLQVRKGQFVYYKNELHKVYSVRPLSKLSVLMYRIKDMVQATCKAEDLILYKPQPMDSLVLLGVRYTLRNDVEAIEDGYIIITRPNPGQMDHYSLNEFEKVESLIDGGVYTTFQNTIRKKEYLVMVPDDGDESNQIDYLDHSIVTASQLEEDIQLENEAKKLSVVKPSVGDVYINLDNGIKAMVVAIINDEVALGSGERIKSADLIESNSWNLIYKTGNENF